MPLGSRPERLMGVARVWLFGAAQRPAEGMPYEVQSVWLHQGRPVVKFRGVDSIGEAEALAGAEVRLPIAQRQPLEEGEYYQADLVDCEVVERAGGVTLGRVAGWREFGGPPLLEVKTPDGAEMLIPFARAICVEIDLQARRITVDLPEGLKELNRE
jgi:16S rRNA processing protein RimM